MNVLRSVNYGDSWQRSVLQMGGSKSDVEASESEQILTLLLRHFEDSVIYTENRECELLLQFYCKARCYDSLMRHTLITYTNTNRYTVRYLTNSYYSLDHGFSQWLEVASS